MIDVGFQFSPLVSDSAILPVEDAEPLGSNHFYKLLAKSLNLIICRVAQKNLIFIDPNSAFDKTEKDVNFTVDGVHLTASSYKIYSKKLLAEITYKCGS
jgi:hypothetical protein